MSVLSGISYIVLRPALAVFNGVHYIFRSQRRTNIPALPELRQIIEHTTAKRTDISDHLATIFSEAAALHPRLIVELGVRGGESRFVFEKVATHCVAHHVSVDIADCAGVCNAHPNWHFV